MSKFQIHPPHRVAGRCRSVTIESTHESLGLDRDYRDVQLDFDFEIIDDEGKPTTLFAEVFSVRDDATPFDWFAPDTLVTTPEYIGRYKHRYGKDEPAPGVLHFEFHTVMAELAKPSEAEERDTFEDMANRLGMENQDQACKIILLEDRINLLTKGLEFYARNIDRRTSNGEIVLHRALQEHDFGDIAKWLCGEHKVPMEFTARYLKLLPDGNPILIPDAVARIKDLKVIVTPSMNMKDISFEACEIHAEFEKYQEDGESLTMEWLHTFGPEAAGWRFISCMVTTPISRSQHVLQAGKYKFLKEAYSKQESRHTFQGVGVVVALDDDYTKATFNNSTLHLMFEQFTPNGGGEMTKEFLDVFGHTESVMMKFHSCTFTTPLSRAHDETHARLFVHAMTAESEQTNVGA